MLAIIGHPDSAESTVLEKDKRRGAKVTKEICECGKRRVDSSDSARVMTSDRKKDTADTSAKSFV